MPAKKKAPGEKKGTVAALIQQKKIDALTYAKCREIAEVAIDKAYDAAVAAHKTHYSPLKN